MIKIDLYKIGAWGTAISIVSFLIFLIAFKLFGPTGEDELVWMIYGGIFLVLNKLVLVFSFVLMFIGLLLDRLKK